MGISMGAPKSSCSCGGNLKKGVRYSNPNPKNFKFKKIEEMELYTIVWINYPDCINYEGDKIMVFENTSIEDLANAKTIDPHFCDGDHISPIARFEPTKRGWEMAVSFIKGFRGY
jgi:hypothetical protein